MDFACEPPAQGREEWLVVFGTRVQAGAIALQVCDYGGDGSPVIFLHFGGGNLTMWEDALSRLSGSYRPVLMDLRGHGKSDRPPTGYDIDTMAGDVVHAMTTLGIDHAHVVGSSLGAEVALAMAVRYPERVLSIVCDGANSSEYGPYSQWDGTDAAFQEHVAKVIARLAARQRELSASVEAALAFERQKYEKGGFWNNRFETLVRYGIEEVEPGKYAYGWPDWLVEYMSHYFACRFEDYYRQLQCPALMVVAAEDLADERFAAVVAGLSSLAGQTRVVGIDGWIHPYGWMLECAGVCREVEAFLGDVEQRRAGA